MVGSGKKYRISLQKRLLVVGHKVIVKDGVINEGYINDIPEQTLDEVLEHVEVLYRQYKYSIPSQASNSRKHIFKALREDELAVEDMMYGMGREQAEAELLTYILLNILNGNLRWDEQRMGKWFWRGSDSDLVLLRNQIEID